MSVALTGFDLKAYTYIKAMSSLSVEAIDYWSAGFACKHKRSLHSRCNVLTALRKR